MCSGKAPEFRPWDPEGERKEPTPESCPLTSPCVCQHVKFIHTTNANTKEIAGAEDTTRVKCLLSKLEALSSDPSNRIKQLGVAAAPVIQCWKTGTSKSWAYCHLGAVNSRFSERPRLRKK